MSGDPRRPSEARKYQRGPANDEQGDLYLVGHCCPRLPALAASTADVPLATHPACLSPIHYCHLAWLQLVALACGMAALWAKVRTIRAGCGVVPTGLRPPVCHLPTAALVLLPRGLMRPRSGCHYYRRCQPAPTNDTYHPPHRALTQPHSLTPPLQWKSWCFGAVFFLLMALANTSGAKLDLKQVVR